MIEKLWLQIKKNTTPAISRSPELSSLELVFRIAVNFYEPIYEIVSIQINTSTSKVGLRQSLLGVNCHWVSPNSLWLVFPI